MLKHMMDALTEIYPHIPVCVHLDHGNEPGTCMTAIQSGFTSVMMDGSLKADGKTPGDWDYNVGVTKTVTDMAHLGGISVEGELGVLGSLETGMGDKEDGHGAEGKLSHDQLLTNPDEAVKFVKETKVDALAIAMGTSHGAYKFTRKPDGEVLAMNVIEEIHRKLPNTHLVMHGSSSVPQDLQDIINKFGGKMKPTWGVPVEEIQRGIKNGVRKINIDTDNRMAMTGQIRKILAETRRVRSAQISEAGDGSDDQALQAAPGRVRHGRPCLENQAAAGLRDGQALQGRQARSEDRLETRIGDQSRFLRQGCFGRSTCRSARCATSSSSLAGVSYVRSIARRGLMSRPTACRPISRQGLPLIRRFSLRSVWPQRCRSGPGHGWPANAPWEIVSARRSTAAGR
jgi:ketose-bisphosphate aldolase